MLRTPRDDFIITSIGEERRFRTWRNWCGRPDAGAGRGYVEYLEGIAMMAQNKSLKLQFVLDLAEWFNYWAKLEPWIDHQREKGYPVFAAGLQWLVEEDQKWFVRMESRADRAS